MNQQELEATWPPFEEHKLIIKYVVETPYVLQPLTEEKYNQSRNAVLNHDRLVELCDGLLHELGRYQDDSVSFYKRSKDELEEIK